MEIAPGIELIVGSVVSRPLQLYLLRGPDRNVLLDTGCAPDPERFIFSSLGSLGLAPEDISMVVNTHPDVDHCGGNAQLKRASPNVLLTCGEADRELIENPQVLYQHRYQSYLQAHGIRLEDGAGAWLREMGGAPARVDFTWRGGETLRLGPDWTVQILRTPGHSQGHLSVFDPRSGTLLMGDAVQGGLALDMDGRRTVYPTYINVVEYLETISLFRSLQPKTLCGCHWPIARGAAVCQFLDESEEFVDEVDRIVSDELSLRPDGITMRELIEVSADRLGLEKGGPELYLFLALSGHLERMAAVKKLSIIRDQVPVVYRRT
jgi:glyoxylase-like metal-dependent hydrolase (beta-lactamase superfamily II)